MPTKSSPGGVFPSLELRGWNYQIYILKPPSQVHKDFTIVLCFRFPISLPGEICQSSPVLEITKLGKDIIVRKRNRK